MQFPSPSPLSLIWKGGKDVTTNLNPFEMNFNNIAAMLMNLSPKWRYRGVNVKQDARPQVCERFNFYKHLTSNVEATLLLNPNRFPFRFS